jgi:hypothetical protein
MWDPKYDRWASAGSMSTARMGHAMATLADGRVLIAGGVGAPTSTEVYDPATGLITAGVPLLSPGRTFFHMATLQDGSVVAAGGMDPNKQYSQLSTTEVFTQLYQCVKRHCVVARTGASYRSCDLACV